jgi:hypothetical protein
MATDELLMTICAFSAEARFCDANAERVSKMARAKIMTEAVQKWAQALCVQCGTLLYLFSGVICVLLHRYS